MNDEIKCVYSCNKLHATETIKTRLKATAVVACILMHEIRIVLNPMTIKTGLKVTALFK